MEYHLPVLLNECIEGLSIRPDGVYVDLTFGGGGHSRAILSQLGNEGKVFAFDQDADAEVNYKAIGDDRLHFVSANFRHLSKQLRFRGVSQVDGILADLGVSSHQFDVPERGFSTRFDAPLDMRMNANSGPTAADVLREYSASALHRLLGMYGEVRNAKTLAEALVSQRVDRTINTVEELKTVLKRFAPRGKENKYYAQVFQALRIEVNQEMTALEEMLPQCAEVLKPGGRLVIMSYHSLEDRLVKNFMKKGNLKGEVEKDFYGNPLKALIEVNRKPIVAGDEELQRNSRARSAKLRIAYKK
ncbi:MAG: 16S rRNA (cytosine(1402)-N(4))-methyltransferase RsmH [Cyclobacteriaceae bacterium]|nr:16S rRNA (cytosine(1402)-N(4))-methyltransferase RsmH [Cyclobacteriaceae bacterium]MCH8516258.1 16S rRNA (cytosine(1402)-N(4))-methyltransferase RsmH [Cyclobacteriaceae bacterium]